MESVVDFRHSVVNSHFWTHMKRTNSSFIILTSTKMSKIVSKINHLLGQAYFSERVGSQKDKCSFSAVKYCFLFTAWRSLDFRWSQTKKFCTIVPKIYVFVQLVSLSYKKDFSYKSSYYFLLNSPKKLPRIDILILVYIYIFSLLVQFWALSWKSSSGVHQLFSSVNIVGTTSSIVEKWQVRLSRTKVHFTIFCWHFDMTLLFIDYNLFLFSIHTF